MTQLTVLRQRCTFSRAEVHLLMFFKADNKVATSGATSLADIDLRRTYRAIDSVATGRIPSLFCASQGKSTGHPMLLQANQNT